VKLSNPSERGTGLKFKLETYSTVCKFTPYTPIKYGANPKRPDSKSWFRYDKYKGAHTVGEALHLVSKVADLFWELERGDYKVLPTPQTPLRLRNMSKKDVETVIKKLETINGPRGLAMNIDADGAADELAREEAWQKGKLDLCRSWASKLGVKLEDETMEDLVEDGVHETSDIRNGRLVANALAEKLLREKSAGSSSSKKISNDDVTECLRLWGFAQNSGRLNVLPGARKWVYSDTLGAIQRRTGGYGVTPPTKRYPFVAKVLNQWLRDNRPSLLSSNFVCTSININANYGARTHRDGNNIGPSAIRAFGEFTGGELWYWPGDDRKAKVESLTHKQAKKLDIKKKTAVFDGTKAHEVEPFEGERISVVFFSCRHHNRVGDENIAFLKNDCGFEWPSEKAMATLKNMGL